MGAWRRRAEPRRHAAVRRSRKVRLVLAAAVLAAAGVAAGGGYVTWRQAGDPLAQARILMERGNAADALFLLRGVARSQPRNAEAHRLLGLAHMRQGNPVAAERVLRIAGSLGAEAGRLRLTLASALLAQRKPQEAFDLLAAADPAAEDFPGVLLARASALEELQDVAGAWAALDRAARLAPRLIDVPLAAAGLGLRARDLASAEREANRALLLNGRSADALLLKAKVLEQRGQRPGALDLLAKAVAADGGAMHVRLERARVLLGAGRTAEARADVDILLAAEPTNVAASYVKAGVLIREADWAGADEILQRLTRYVPFLPRGWYAVATVKLHLEQLEQAAVTADKHVVRVPEDLEGRKLRARIGLAERRPGLALASLSDPVSSGTADAEAFDLVGTAQAMAGRLAEAEKTFAQAAAFAPSNPGIRARLGTARLLAGDAPGAVEALEHSLALAAAPEVSEQLVVAAAAAGRPERAAAALAELRQRSGDTAANGRLEAVLALAQLDFDDAESRLAELAARHPADSAARLQLARVQAVLGRTAEAEAALAAILSMEPAHEAALGILVPMLERAGRRPDAAAALERARAAAPGNERLTLMLSALHGRAGDHGKALAAFRLVSAQPSAAPQVLLARAEAEAADGQPAAARRTYEGLLGSMPAAPAVVVRFADFLASQGAHDEAGQRLAAALAMNPGDPEMQRALVRLRYRAAGIDAALAVADALRRDPANLPASALLRGDALLAAGRFAEAASALEAEMRTVPSSLLAVRTATAMHAAHGPVAAIRVLRPWTLDHPDDFAALTALAAMHLAAKQSAAAAGVLERLLAARPNDPEASNNLAWAYNDMGDIRAYPLALRAYLATFSPNVADTLGCVLLNQGRTQEALALLRFAARELPDNLPVQLHLAQAMRQAGLRDAARELLAALAAKDFDGRATAKQLLASVQAR